MEFDVSYYKFHGVDRAGLIDALGLYDTGTPDPGGEAPYAIADLPNGWFVIRVDNDSGLLADYDRNSLAREGMLVTCDVGSVDPVSRSQGYDAGEERWSVVHDGRGGEMLALEIRGEAPPGVSALHEEAFAATRAMMAHGGTHGPGPMFGVPLAVVKSVTGFRHDEPQLVSPEPVFTWLAPKDPK
ncbi:hypothetical protein HNW77_12580 [Komagataeibacter sp. AV436]|uniref:Uncharacterized protein n=1 Tax=Komagataeibacter melomenusus TaxID=2766578 RepID=A0ABX2AFR9_9PROT|nr:hypothetical protein [Komagataeibacter melomenusus]MBV1831785.1 hypothetical protein [Komagataeibacter melomenusus]NPC67208.1 hypothetical protein [Komagataeibacter melomenusus]